MHTQIWAHRGASAYAPENTMEAFLLAYSQGADGIELDVHLSGDGEVVVAHDESLERVSDGKGFIKDYPLKELKQMNFNSGKKEYEFVTIPTLREVLKKIKNTQMLVNIELKTDIFPYKGIEKKVFNLVKEYNMKERVIYSSFHWDSIGKLRELDKDSRIGMLFSRRWKEAVAYAREIGANAIHPPFRAMLDNKFAESCRREGLAVHVWTVNNEQDCIKMINKGVDAIITDYSDQCKLVMQQCNS